MKKTGQNDAPHLSFLSTRKARGPPTKTARLLVWLISQLSFARERQIRENRIGFRPGRTCTDHILILRQILEYRYTFRHPAILVFLDLKAAFGAVDRKTLWYYLSQNGEPAKFVNILKSLYSQFRG